MLLTETNQKAEVIIHGNVVSVPCMDA